MRVPVVPRIAPIQVRSGLVNLDISLEGAPVEIDIDVVAMTTKAAALIAVKLRDRARRGLAVDGSPLPPIKPATARARQRRGIADTHTPMHATGAYAESIRANGSTVEATGSKDAIDHYGEDRLMGVPADADPQIEAVMLAAVKLGG